MLNGVLGLPAVAGVSPAKMCSFAPLHGNDKVIEPHEQAGELDVVDTTTYFRRYDGKRTIEERDFRDRR